MIKLKMDKKATDDVDYDNVEDGNLLDLEWRLENIKNRNLKELKHFSSNFEPPSYGFKQQCVE